MEVILAKLEAKIQYCLQKQDWQVAVQLIAMYNELLRTKLFIREHIMKGKVAEADFKGQIGGESIGLDDSANDAKVPHIHIVSDSNV